ncbi:MAG: Pr6Pr family membrane protein [Ferruginibacter sp.]
MPQSSAVKNYAGLGAVIVWLSLALQFYVSLKNTVVSIAETTIRFFSYYTVESNLLIAICLTAVYFKGITEKGNFFARPKTLTATAVYICIVGLTYNVILRFQWNPQGIDRVPDELLHLIIPIIYLIFWSRFVSKQNIEWKNILPGPFFLLFIYCTLYGVGQWLQIGTLILF